jgi:hypothetical protein
MMLRSEKDKEIKCNSVTANPSSLWKAELPVLMTESLRAMAAVLK